MAKRAAKTRQNKAPPGGASPQRAPTAAVAGNRSWLPWLLAAGLAIATAILYAPVVGHEFLDFDDSVYVTENPRVRQGLSPETVAWAWTSFDEANWHPLAWMSHLLDVSLYGADPDGAWGHHLTNLFLHALNSALALLVLNALTGRLWPSALVAALFAWHPLHVESVAWIAERKDVLSATFFWLTLGAYAGYVRRGQTWARWSLVALLFALGLAAKPMLVTLPFVLLLLDYWPLDRFSARQSSGESPPTGRWSPSAIWPLCREKTLLFALTAASCVVTYIAQERGGAVAKGELAAGMRIKNALVAYVAYLEKTVWPSDLAFLYPYRAEIPVIEVLAAAVGLSLATAMALWVLLAGPQRRGWLPVGWFWYLGMLLPVIGLVQVGSQALADRYTYLPLVGIFIVFSWGIAALVAYRPGWRYAVLGAIIVVLAAYVATTRTQIGHWRDCESLYRHAISVTEGNATAHSNLGRTLHNRALASGDRALVDEAMGHFQAALAIKPRLSQAHDGLGAIHLANGDYALAAIAFRRGHELAPNEPRPANNLAWVLATSPDPQVRRPQEAVELAEAACERTGYADPSLLDTLAAAYAAAGRFEQAVAAADRAQQLAHSQRQPGLAAGIAERRQLYAAGQSYVAGSAEGDSRPP